MDDKNMECMTELEDFELEPCEYRVLAHGFDLNGDELPGTLVLWANPDPDEAIQVAKEKLKNFEDLHRAGGCGSKWGGKQLSLVVISVETVIKVEGEEQYAGTLFTDGVLV